MCIIHYIKNFIVESIFLLPESDEICNGSHKVPGQPFPGHQLTRPFGDVKRF